MKKAKCSSFSNVRILIEFINSRNISKEDILNVIQKDNQFYLIYFE